MFVSTISLQIMFNIYYDKDFWGHELSAFALTPFLGDNTRFFKNGRRFLNVSASRGRSFCGSSNRLVGLP